MNRIILTSVFAIIAAASALGQTPLGPEFGYQGVINKDSAPLNGDADFQFRLFTAPTGGTQIGSTQTISSLDVVDGLISVELNFGAAAFNGHERWLEIAVRSPAGIGQFTTLSPRQAITAVPYALKVPGVSGHALHAPDGNPENAVFVDVNGRVGVGTTDPSHSLHMRASIPIINVQDSDSAGAQQAGYVRFADSGNAERGYVGFGSQLDTNLSLLNLYADGATLLGAGGSTRLALAANGNVGIGTVSPSMPLHVRAEEPVLILQDSGSNVTQSGYLGFWNASLAETGWVGFGTPGSPHFSVRNARSGGNIQLLPGAGGVVSVPVLEITGADLAEKFPTSEKVEPGMVVAIDRENPGKLCLARGAYNRCVAGVVSGANNFSVGAVLGNLPGHEDAPPIALSGRVYVWCDASSAAIQPGDLLTVSDTAGHAMKAVDGERSQGAVIGKAMTALESGRGMVLVLVNLQ